MDLRRVFLTYLEAPNSVLVKNPKITEFLLNFPIFSYKLPINHRWPRFGPPLATGNKNGGPLTVRLYFGAAALTPGKNGHQHGLNFGPGIV